MKAKTEPRRARRIRMKLSTNNVAGLQLGGWYQGKETYLWIGQQDKCLGYVDGQKLLRFARTVVKEMERKERKP